MNPQIFDRIRLSENWWKGDDKFAKTLKVMLDAPTFSARFFYLSEGTGTGINASGIVPLNVPSEFRVILTG
jgi:hypothetical protein